MAFHEDSFPLSQGNARWGIKSNLNKKFGLGDVLVVGLEKPTSFFATGIAIGNWGVIGLEEPGHITFK